MQRDAALALAVQAGDEGVAAWISWTRVDDEPVWSQLRLCTGLQGLPEDEGGYAAWLAARSWTASAAGIARGPLCRSLDRPSRPTAGAIVSRNCLYAGSFQRIAAWRRGSCARRPESSDAVSDGGRLRTARQSADWCSDGGATTV